MSVPKTYAQIREQIEALQREAELLRREEVKSVVAKILETIERYGLTSEDLGFVVPRRRRAAATRRASRKRSAGTAVKYRDAQGNTWGGRGPRPRWLRDALAAGHDLTEFAA